MFSSNQVPVKNIKLKQCLIIKLLIKSDFPATDLPFTNVRFSMFSGADCGLMGTVISFEQFLVCAEQAEYILFVPVTTGMGSCNGTGVIVTAMSMLGLLEVWLLMNSGREAWRTYQTDDKTLGTSIVVGLVRMSGHQGNVLAACNMWC
ncbi:MAG: hypothetical protein ACRC41_07755, partial [Sarcina sp.]